MIGGILNNNEFAKCKMFPEDYDDYDYLISGIKKERIIDYHYCGVARKFRTMCGEEGKYYSEIKKQQFPIFKD